jgi:hypothetical protein
MFHFFHHNFRPGGRVELQSFDSKFKNAWSHLHQTHMSKLREIRHILQ